ncbi:hypothetical protein [Novosphingobium sp. M1R2S20]|uniref:Uncharacterized protein n=1 Tax=Novosphingobium rhizovicinum TaxID=3228928 RepID=A0ABV3R9F2_9SPHN
MKYKNDVHRAREAHARDCASKLAAHVGWAFASRPELLPPAVRDYFYEPSAQLVLIPWAGERMVGVESAVRETRCTALILEPGATNAGLATSYFTVVRCAGGKVHRHPALRLWASLSDALCLVPDPYGDDPEGSCFAVSRQGIVPAEAPWTNALEHGFGFGNADALMLAAKKLEWR